MTDPNGRLKLTWSQITWAIAVLVALVSAWFDLRGQQQAILIRLGKLEVVTSSNLYDKRDIDVMLRDAKITHDDLDRRLRTLESRR